MDPIILKGLKILSVPPNNHGYNERFKDTSIQAFGYILNAGSSTPDLMKYRGSSSVPIGNFNGGSHVSPMIVAPISK